ncbi:MAG: hypothetical protein GY913_00060, partial [Proteobacteria bacterium]|nr:hypothetical protein [Pseudomonadota bacterium]
GRYQAIVMPEDIDKAMAAAHAPDRAASPWRTHTAEMWRKTAIKRVLGGGLVPLSRESVRALEIDATEVEDAVVVEQPRRSWADPSPTRAEPSRPALAERRPSPEPAPTRDRAPVTVVDEGMP